MDTAQSQNITGKKKKDDKGIAIRIRPKFYFSDAAVSPPPAHCHCNKNSTGETLCQLFHS